jgi:hypothetical protein
MRVVKGNSVRNNVVNIKGAPVGLGCFTANTALYIANPNFLCSFLPESIIHWIGVFAEVFTNKVVDVFTAKPFDFTFRGTKFSDRALAICAANDAFWQRLLLGVVSAFSRAKPRFVNPILRLKDFAALWTGFWFLTFFGFAIASMRAKLSNFCPLSHRNTGFFGESLAAIDAFFFKAHLIVHVASIAYMQQ